MSWFSKFGRKQAVPADSCFWKNFITAVCEKITATENKLNHWSIASMQQAVSPCRGVVLIEFAVCMPILIILLFYINDLVRIKRYYSQMEFVGQQMVNILQNISNGQQINKQQLKYAALLAYQTVYPGKTIYCDDNSAYKHSLFHWPWIKMYRVKGQSGGKAYCQWGKQYQIWDITSPTGSVNNGATMYGYSISSNVTHSKVNYYSSSSATAASNIYPSLKMGETDEKIILENHMYWDTSYKDANGNAAKNAKEVYGLHFAIPNDYPDYNASNATSGSFFPSVVIFTPKQGILDNAPED